MWSEEEIDVCRAAWRETTCHASDQNPERTRMRAAITRAVQLVAARGGTMTAGGLTRELIRSTSGEMVLNHLAAQGARVAALEADLAAARQALIREGVERDEACRKADEQRERAGLAESALAAERTGDAQMKADFGALPGETLRGMVARIAKERDAATQLAAHRLKGRMDAASEAERLRAERDACRGRAEDAEAHLQRMRDGINNMVKRCVEMAMVGGEPKHAPLVATPDEGRCAERFGTGPQCRLGAGHPGQHAALIVDYPCSPTCTHDDAATPGHPERVKERSEAFNVSVHSITPAMEDAGAAAHDAAVVESGEEQEARGFDEGAEAMRAACWEAVQNFLQREGLFDLSHGPAGGIKAAIEGATP